MDAPPHNPEAERAVLGAVLVDNDTLTIATDSLAPGDFYLPSYRQIFASMIELAEQSHPIDVLTLGVSLQEAGHLEAVGGAAGLAEIIDAVPTAANAAHYVEIVHRHALQRRIISAARRVIGQAGEPYDDTATLVADTQAVMADVIQDGAPQDYCSISDLAKAHWDEIKSGRPRALLGVETGFRRLDWKLRGLHPGQVIVVAGRPSMGKTALALSIAGNAVSRKKPDGTRPSALIVTLEMDREQIFRRILSMKSRIPGDVVRTNAFQHDDFERLVPAETWLHTVQLFVDDSPSMSAAQLRAKARKVQEDHGLDLIVVDYLQLMKPSSHRDSNREREVAGLSRAMKEIAKEFRCPVLVLSQLNRALESRTCKRPTMSDLRESGAIEQDADVILFIYRDEVYNRDSKDKGTAEIIIAKQRDGETGRVILEFDGPTTRFLDPPPEKQ